MKIQIEVDCTPQEARSFLGLPEVAPMQRRMMDELESRMIKALSDADPQALLDQWLPLGMKGVEQWQGLWTEMVKQAAGMGTASRRGGEDDGDEPRKRK